MHRPVLLAALVTTSLLAGGPVAEATEPASPTPPTGRAASGPSDVCGVVTGVGRTSRTFRLRTVTGRRIAFKVTAATHYIHLSGFAAVKVGRRLEVYYRRSGSTRRATSLEPYRTCDRS
ncbi:MAG TPA: hypothetical protein VIK38_10695 [Coriobacteriia bacterium]